MEAVGHHQLGLSIMLMLSSHFHLTYEELVSCFLAHLVAPHQTYFFAFAGISMTLLTTTMHGAGLGYYLCSLMLHYMKLCDEDKNLNIQRNYG